MMKNFFVFLLGFIVGCAFIIAVDVIITADHNNDNGMTFFEHPGEPFKLDRFVILQSLGEGNHALAQGQEQYMEKDYWGRKYKKYRNLNLVLIINDKGEYYYDEQIIDIPKEKIARQVGIYKYQTKTEDWKTVPIVKLLDE